MRSHVPLPARLAAAFVVLGLSGCGSSGVPASPTEDAVSGAFVFMIVDTGQATCYDDAGPIAAPSATQAFHGQDAQYAGASARYVDHGDGTLGDLVTGLMWQQDPGAKVTFDQARAGAGSFRLAGHDDESAGERFIDSQMYSSTES